MSTKQLLESYNDIKKAIPSAKSDFIRDYAAVKDEINEILKGISPQFGTGSPEGIVTSTASLLYYDVTLSPISVEGYFNDTVGINTGWVKIL